MEVLTKLKNLDPYNPRIREMKDKLELELELAQKFRNDSGVSDNELTASQDEPASSTSP